MIGIVLERLGHRATFCVSAISADDIMRRNESVGISGSPIDDVKELTGGDPRILLEESRRHLEFCLHVAAKEVDKECVWAPGLPLRGSVVYLDHSDDAMGDQAVFWRKAAKGEHVLMLRFEIQKGKLDYVVALKHRALTPLTG